MSQLRGLRFSGSVSGLFGRGGSMRESPRFSADGSGQVDEVERGGGFQDH